MLQTINCRSSVLRGKKNFYFFHQIKKVKNKNLITLSNIFYQNHTLLLNLLISNHQKKKINSFLFLKKNINTILTIFKKNLVFSNKFLTDMAVYDVPGKINRFTLVIMLQSIKYNTRIELIVKTNEVSPVVSSYNTFNSAC